MGSVTWLSPTWNVKHVKDNEDNLKGAVGLSGFQPTRSFPAPGTQSVRMVKTFMESRGEMCVWIMILLCNCDYIAE